MTLTREDYVFFWTKDEPNGWASQWYLSPFKLNVKLNDKEEEVEFLTAEHWMMFNKATLFGDTNIAKEVLKVKGTTKASMTLVKSLGRKVQNFSEEKWLVAREKIVLEGNLHKFRQNKDLLEKLLATGTKQMVEASPRDRIWGIGYGEKNAMLRKDNWGLNLLGKALDETRRILLEEQV